MGNRSSRSYFPGIQMQPAKTTLFRQEQAGITYRIPSLIYLKETRTFLAFAEKRSSPSDHDAKTIVFRRGSQQNGSTEWSDSQELLSARLPGHRTMNPCPVYEKNTKTLFLFFICILGHTTEHQQIRTGKNKAQLCYITSDDEGQTWSPIKDLTESVIGKTIRSDDFGVTWQVGRMLQRKSSECEMAEIIDHEGRSHLYCNARNTEGYRVEALSESAGLYFDKPHLAPELVEMCHGGCQGSVIGFPAPELGEEVTAGATSSPMPSDVQTWLLFTHPTGSKRKDLGVYLNRSPLHTHGWDRPWVVHSGPSGYSDLAYSKETDRFACLMECGEKSELEQIAFLTFPLSDVMQNIDEKERTF
ncbi:hypothetical protein DPEC_G00239530 [Dallia pectoralis]|uniref:Uncharacterized protein n=1 Tax=Dallia pectoralis TaxID=75939 RepID=A0ACC2FZ54_DALPE|nr:hypothetical protein DPEC_G00239530 [Dallia pectoralis]